MFLFDNETRLFDGTTAGGILCKKKRRLYDDIFSTSQANRTLYLRQCDRRTVLKQCLPLI